MENDKKNISLSETQNKSDRKIEFLNVSAVSPAESQTDYLLNQKKIIEARVMESSEKLKNIEKKQLELIKRIEEEISREKEEQKQKKQLRMREVNNIVVEGKSLYRQKQYEKAIEVWEKAFVFDSQNDLVINLIKEAEQMILYSREEKEREKELQGELEKEKREKLNLGRTYYREGQYRRAIEVWDEILRKEGENTEILALISKTENRIKEINDELDRAKREKEEREKVIKRYFLEGRRHFRQENYEKAIEIWENVYSIDPENKTVVEEIRRAEKSLQERMGKESKARRVRRDTYLSLQLESMRAEREEKFDLAIKHWEEIALYNEHHDQAIREIKRLESKLFEKRELEEKHQRKSEEIRQRERDKEEIERLQRDQESRKHFYNGQNFFRSMQYESAIREWEQILINDPERHDIRDLVRLASEKMEEQIFSSQVQEEQNNKAWEEFNRVIMEARKALMLGYLEEAFQAAERAGNLHMDDEKINDLFRQIKQEQDRKEKLKSQKKREREEKQKSYHFLMNEGDRLVGEGKYSDALVSMEKAFLYFPEDQTLQEKIFNLNLMMNQEKEQKERKKDQTARLEIEVLRVIQEKDFDSAEDISMNILSLDPHSRECRDLYHRLQTEIAGKKKSFEEEVQKQKLEELELYSSAVQYVEKDEWEQAYSLLDKLFLLNAEHEEGRKMKDYLHQVLVENKEREQKQTEKEDYFRNELVAAETNVRAFMRDGKYREAIGCYLGLLEKFPEKQGIFEKISEIEALEKEKIEKGAEEREKEQENFRKELIEQKEMEQRLRQREKELLIQGIKFYESGEYASAVRSLEELLMDFSSNEKAQHYLSKSKESIERMERERKENLEKEKNREREARRLYYEGRKTFREGQYELALEYFEKTAEISGINQRLSEEIHRAELKIKEERTQFLKQRDMEEERRDKINKLDLGAKKCFRENDFLKAIANWEDILVIALDHPSARLAIEEAEKKLETLNEEQRKVAKEKEEKIIQYTLAGMRAMGTNNFTVALENFQRILLLDPDNEEAKRGQEKTLKLKEEFEDRDMEKQKLLIQENRKKESLTFSFQQEMKNKIENINELALKYFENGEFHRAIAEWKKIKILSPENHWVDEEMRKAQLRVKEQQIRELQRTELEDQEKTKTNFLWIEGRKSMRHDEYEKALECFEGILYLDKGNHEVRAEIRYAEQRLKEQKAEVMRRENERKLLLKKLTALVHQGNKYFYNENYQKAIEAWEEALSIEPDNRNLRDAILKAEEKLFLRQEKERIFNEEQFEKEKEIHLREIKAKRDVEKSNRIWELLNRANGLFRAGKHEEALKIYEEAQKIDPYSPEVRERLKQAEYEYIEWKKTKKMYEKEEEKNKKECDFHETLAEQKFSIGNFLQALEEWKQVLLINPRRKDIVHKMEEVEELIKEKEEELRQKQQEPLRKELEMQRLKEVREKEKKQRIEKIFEKGRELFERGQYTKAAGIWKEILLIDGHNDFIREEIRKTERLVEENRAEEKKERMMREKKKLEDDLRKHREKELEKEALVGRLRIEAVRLLKEGDAYEAASRYEKILAVTPGDKEALKSLDELQRYIMEMEKERRQSQDHLVEDLEFLQEQKIERKAEWVSVKKEIAAIKAELKNVYKAARDFMRVNDYDRAMQDVSQALFLAQKYSIKNVMTFRLNQLYIKLKTEHEKGLELKARIMAASSNISIPEALERIKKEKKLK